MVRSKVKISTPAREIREKIEQLMQERSIFSYRKLAQSAGYSPAALSLLVRGKLTYFQPTVGARLSIVFGIKPAEFYAIFGIDESTELERVTKLYHQYLSADAESIELLDQRYHLLASRLERSYDLGTFSIKAQILGGLELLVRTYEVK